jgi:hypothetical protein
MSKARATSLIAGLAFTSLLSACPNDPVIVSVDAPAPDAGSDAGPPEPDICDELGLARVPMRASTGTMQGAVAGDFTVNELEAQSFHLAEEWTGCESYVFLTYFPRASGSGVWEGDALFGSLSGSGITDGPRNVQYFFMSNEEDAEMRATRMGGVSGDFDDALLNLGTDEERDFWRTRVHFVTDRATEIEGAPGAYLRDYLAYARTPEAIVDLGDRGRAGMPTPFAFGIDRDQRFDPGDSLAPSVGTRSNFSMVRFLPDYYNYLHDLDARLAAETATVVPVLADERNTTRIFTREVTLPAASEMAAFDTLEFDVAITCDERNPFACSEWDRIANIFLCSDAMCTQTNELARWITPYWRRGTQHWTLDASALLGLLRQGGTRTLRIELGPEWERATEWVTHVAMRFSSRGGPRAMGAIPAYRGGAFDGTYNDMHAPMQFTVPAGATRVELVTILSGHGQTAGANCAEWCDHRHAFQVGTTALPPLQHTSPTIGSGLGCAARAREGVIPGQLGNWAQARAYWCPGLPVPATRTDITSLVTPGTETTLSYTGSYRASAPQGGDIALSSYVVWYGP